MLIPRAPPRSAMEGRREVRPDARDADLAESQTRGTSRRSARCQV